MSATHWLYGLNASLDALYEPRNRTAVSNDLPWTAIQYHGLAALVAESDLVSVTKAHSDWTLSFSPADIVQIFAGIEEITVLVSSVEGEASPLYIDGTDSVYLTDYVHIKAEEL
mgnify:CR=1 FL=1